MVLVPLPPRHPSVSFSPRPPVRLNPGNQSKEGCPLLTLREVFTCSVNSLYTALPIRPPLDGWWKARKATSSRSSESVNGVRLCSNGEVSDKPVVGSRGDITHTVDGVPLGITIGIGYLEDGDTISSQRARRGSGEEGMARRNVAKCVEHDATTN